MRNLNNYGQSATIPAITQRNLAGISNIVNNCNFLDFLSLFWGLAKKG